jgi:hypothetical protein
MNTTTLFSSLNSSPSHFDSAPPNKRTPLQLAVLSAVNTIGELVLESSHPHSSSPEHRTGQKALLALLVYSYATQVYASADIASKFVTSGTADGNLSPLVTVEALRGFRVANRDALRLCLFQVLCSIAEEKRRSGIVTKVKLEHLAEEASRRITTAAFMDHVEID